MHLSMLEINVINDSTVGSLANRYKYFSIYERGRRINALRDSLLNICQSCTYAETISVYLKPIEMKLNDKSGLDAMTAADETFVKEIAENSRNAICMKDEDLYAVVCVRDTKNEPYYTLVVRLSKERISADLKSLESSVPTQSVVIFEGRTALAANSKKAAQEVLIPNLICLLNRETSFSLFAYLVYTQGELKWIYRNFLSIRNSKAD